MVCESHPRFPGYLLSLGETVAQSVVEGDSGSDRAQGIALPFSACEALFAPEGGGQQNEYGEDLKAPDQHSHHEQPFGGVRKWLEVPGCPAAQAPD